eukprot:TRINITY_DN20562_c0_g1_i1.p1 TRINITY_DN20562_c0_g1~~TRINITY_DN20562_c0_g1_i1.p1  ORF type:complete len:262 (+),score=-23.55 TRINITY_DN20562_c0_g1_i1:270-1055(+)
MKTDRSGRSGQGGSLTGLGGETVSAAAHGLDQAFVAGGLQGRAQAADVHIHGALLDEHMIAPHLVQQLGPAVDPLRVGHEEVQQAEFRRPQVHRAAVAQHPVGNGIQAQAFDIHRVLGHLGRPPAQHCLDAGLQLPGGEGFGDVVVGPGLEAGDLVVLLAPGGEHDDGHVLGPLVGPQLAGELHAGHAGQHPVQQDHVGQHLAHLALRLFGIVGPQHLVPGMLQIGGDQFLDRGFVFDDKDVGWHWVGCPLSFAEKSIAAR